MQGKIKIGIIFGGSSREREISFAGGRTVYDNLNKTLFEAVPIFVDSFGNFVLLNWQYVYKGSIRDFYPPTQALPTSANEFQIYAESIGNLNEDEKNELVNPIGKIIEAKHLKNYFDIAFLALHGPMGEDGTIQGLFEYYKIPYTGSGILASAIGIDKAIQKQMMVDAGFLSPNFFVIEKDEWNKINLPTLFDKAKKQIGFPLVIKSVKQGSSIGITILNHESITAFEEAVEKSFFVQRININDWNKLNDVEKINFVRKSTDIREGIGIPILVSQFNSNFKTTHLMHHPEQLLSYLNAAPSNETIVLENAELENEVLIEGFVSGKEFSCIVLQNESTKQEPIALPPTEIVKGNEMFDYRSKYLPGLARKITPINIEESKIQKIRTECERLFTALHFNVYARIDGFITDGGDVFLNDPNTTSGMMPSSFFFHQAAEIGLNPSQFLTYIIKASLRQRKKTACLSTVAVLLLSRLNHNMIYEKEMHQNKTKVAVLLGGYSSERHISVESGRNIFEKLSSSEKYQPIPIFVTGNSQHIHMYQLPINLLLKDNADDIKQKIAHFDVHPIIQKIIAQCSNITSAYSNKQSIAAPKQITFDDLKKQCDAVFIALHGRPGEDGAIQIELEKIGLPFNGSRTASSKITINKYLTNEILSQNGFHVAKHSLASKQDWLGNADDFIKKIESNFEFPFIAKPVDDGCSSAVRKVKNDEELKAFAKLIFRNSDALDQQSAQLLKIKLNEEFPEKNEFLVESLINKQNAKHFLEITIGLLTHYNKNGEIEYEVFEASEALSEGEVLSLEEKFLAGQGQNITPARFSANAEIQKNISNKVKLEIAKAAKLLNIQGYCRIDAFVRIDNDNEPTVIFIEVNSLPGMTPATCIFHQTAIAGYTPYQFIDNILEFGKLRNDKL